MAEIEIPSDDEVVEVLTQELNGHATAVDLCRALVAKNHPLLQSQIAIQRAADRGKIVINRDWSLSEAVQAAAA